MCIKFWGITSALAAMGLLLNACSTPPPIPWQANEAYVKYAITKVPKPAISGRCVNIIPNGSLGSITVRNEDYPWDKYTFLSYSAEDIMGLAAKVATQAWRLSPSVGSPSVCQNVYAAIVRVQHVFSGVGAFANSPAVCVALRLSLERAATEPAIYVGTAIGKVVHFADRDDAKTIRDYNDTAYVALFRALSYGIGHEILKKHASITRRVFLGPSWIFCNRDYKNYSIRQISQGNS